MTTTSDEKVLPTKALREQIARTEQEILGIEEEMKSLPLTPGVQAELQSDLQLCKGYCERLKAELEARLSVKHF